MYHSQNNEAQVVLEYFDRFTGRLLDIGANDGVTFSNSYDLIKAGWRAELIEPSPVAFDSLLNLYSGNRDVRLREFGIGIETRLQKFYDSGAHVTGGSDKAIVSTFVPAELDRWVNVDFKEMEVEIKTIQDARLSGVYHFISIDCEGMDIAILEQLDLKKFDCSCICVEHNSNKETKKRIVEYCAGFGLMKELTCNAENIILAR